MYNKEYFKEIYINIFILPLNLFKNLICYIVYFILKEKIVPITIEKLLTPIGLAYWIMDDGSWVNTRYHLNTNGFERTHVEILTKALFNKFHLKCSV